MLKNIQYYRKTKYPDKVAKPKCLVFVRIFLFCSVGIKIQYFPTAPSNFLSALCPNTASIYIVAIVVNPLICKHLTKIAATLCAEPIPLT